MIYITPDEYEQAAANGISADTLKRRIHAYGWDKQRAITTPVQKRDDPFIRLAAQNGISEGTYLKRIYSLKWDKERAATTPLQIFG